MNQEYSFYDPATGLFTSTRRSLPSTWDIRDYTPAGTVAVAGIYEASRFKVDLATGKVVVRTPVVSTQVQVDEVNALAEADRLEQAQIGTLIALVAALATPGGKPATADIAKLAAARQKVADLRAKKPKP